MVTTKWTVHILHSLPATGKAGIRPLLPQGEMKQCHYVVINHLLSPLHPTTSLLKSAHKHQILTPAIIHALTDVLLL